MTSEVALDADVLTNLAATGDCAGVLAVCGFLGIVVPRVEREVLYLEPLAGVDREIIDLEPLFNSGVLQRTVLASDESETFVRLAAELDDGEAQVLSVALCRSVPAATDDRKARRVAARLGIRTLETPELLSRWAAQALGAMPSELARALLAVEVRARYRPPRDSALWSWWDSARSFVSADAPDLR